jgi:hypothetical protein
MDASPRGGEVCGERIGGRHHKRDSTRFVAKKSRWFHRVSQFVTLHPAACGRQVSWGIRQSIPEKRYESCATLIVTTPSVIVGKHAPWPSYQIIFYQITATTPEDVEIARQTDMWRATYPFLDKTAAR